MSLIERIEYWDEQFQYHLHQYEQNGRRMDSKAADDTRHHAEKAAQCASILTALRASDGEAGK